MTLTRETLDELEAPAQKPQHDFAIASTIIRGVVGSRAHGLNIEGYDDRDEMGICVEPPEYVCGLRHFEQYIYRDQPDGVRSQPGDLDLTIYSLRKFCRLAVQGNPSILILLWLPKYEILTEAGKDLLSIREKFFSRDVGERHLGYLVSQRKALTGERSKKVNRPELVERYGYDTKFAGHAVRLGFQGLEYLQTRRLSLPMPEAERGIVMSIRRGEMKLLEALSLIASLEQRLKNEIDNTLATADMLSINETMIRIQMGEWFASSVVA